jgi:C1A family cysteine protease
MCYESDIIRVDPNTRLVSYYEVEDTNFVEKMLLKKPINVNLCSKDLQFYAPNSGSRTLSCTSGQTNRDHTVLLVGYTETEWIIKNQWSPNWGVDGFGYISK